MEWEQWIKGFFVKLGIVNSDVETSVETMLK